MTKVARFWRFEFTVFAVTVISVALAGLLAVARLTPSARVDAPASEFSAARAAETLRRLELAQPHPVGADEHVREHVVERLRELGYAVETPASYACSPDATCSPVTNVVAHLDGTEPGPAILLTAHYDSVRGGPGVADDGAGVAVVLEVARLMKAGPPQRRPLIFLLSDGEEAGLLGARAFAATPAIRAVGAVVNLEARGGTGPSLMFETSAGNAWVTAALSRLPHPVTSSLFATVYAQLSNDTDFSVYKALGIAGVNFAFIGNGCTYHSAYDDIARLSIGSLQDQGDHALAMVRAFEGSEKWPPPNDNQDAVFFDVASVFVASWPVSLAPWLALAAVFLVGASAAALLRRRQASLWGTARALLAIIFLWPAIGLVGAGMSALLHKGTLIVAPWPPVAWGVALIVLSIPIAVSWAAGRALRRSGGASTWIALWAAWSLLAAFVSVRLPTASYLFVPPSLAAGLSGAVWSLLPDERKLTRVVAFVFPPVVVALLWAPFAAVLYQAIGAHALPVIAVAVAPIAFGTIPPLAALQLQRFPSLPLVVFGMAATGVVITALTPRFSAAEPDHVPIEYVEDADEHRAATVLPMTDHVPPSLAALGFHGETPFGWTHPWEHFGPFAMIEPLGLAPPDFAIATTEHSASGDRTIRGVLRSKRDAPTVALLLHVERIVVATVEDTLVPERGRPTSGWWKIESRVTSPAGARVAITLRGEEPVDVEILDETSGTPPSSSAVLRALPEWAASAQDGELTVVARHQVL